ncbi:GAP family protein [Methanobacterium sp.]|uniref:GAP family protein n=1 Tax=Methanobacterium sp. TaxID=2164 RepID=UPI003C7711BF
MSELSILLTNVLPLAIGAAVSPTVLIGIILILSMSDRPKLSGIAFYIGAIIILLSVAAAGVLLGKGAAVASSKHPSVTSAYFDLALGILLILLGIGRIVKKGSGGPNESRFGGKSKSPASDFIRYMILGLGMFTVNFTTTVLVFAAGKDIGVSSAGITDKVTVVIILTLMTLLVVEIPLLIYFTMPERSEKLLGVLNTWMQKNSRYLMAAVMFVFGIYLMLKGSWVLF